LIILQTMQKDKFAMYYNSFHTSRTILQGYDTIKFPQLVIFSLIVALLDKTGVTTQKDVTTANTGRNKALSKSTTFTHVKLLQDAGLITKVRSKQYFSPSYISLTKSGLLLKSRLSSLLDSSLLPGD